MMISYLGTLAVMVSPSKAQMSASRSGESPGFTTNRPEVGVLEGVGVL
jgi:hypothetical protein